MSAPVSPSPTDIIFLPLSPSHPPPPPCADCDTAEEDELPLVLLTFALRISPDVSALLQVQEHPSPSRDTIASIAKQKRTTPERRAVRGQRLSSPGVSRRTPATEIKTKAIPKSNNTPLVLPNRPRKLFAGCENQPLHKFGVQVGKPKTRTRSCCSYNRDEKENIPPLRRMSFSLDL